MLEGLDAIDWGKLGHAYGPASDTPDHIRALASLDPDVRDQALGELGTSIQHQGTVYEATAYAVPFLLELLAVPSVPDKAALLGFLSSLEEGSSYLDVHKDLFVFDQERDTPEFQAKLAQELAWVQQVHAAVAEGFPLYLDFLAHPDSEIRSEAAHLLSYLESHAERSIPKLQALIAKEQDTAAKATALLSLGNLIKPESVPFDFLCSFLSSDDERLRLVAAIAAIRCAREQAPSQAVDVVMQAVEKARRLDPFYWHFSRYGGVAEDAHQAFCVLGSVRAIPILLALLQRLDPEEGYQKIEVAASLLDFAFYGEAVERSWAFGRTKDGREQVQCWSDARRKDASEKHLIIWDDPADLARISGTLTEPQRAVLTALVENEAFWMVESNLLAQYDLPHSRELLRRILF